MSTPAPMADPSLSPNLNLPLSSDETHLLAYLSERERAAMRRLLQAEAQEKARAHLIEFAQFVDPLVAYWYRAPHLREIAEKLEAVERGEIRRLIITVPPRHWKSSIAAVKWPACCLGKDAKDTFILGSHSETLAVKFSKAVRDTIEGNPYYRWLYPKTRIKQDSNRADDWLLEGGYQSSFRAVGTGTGVAGFGARKIVLDDVSDPNKQASERETENDWEWYKNVIRTRLEPDGAIVVINNRVGVNDLVGHLLSPELNDSADPPEDWTYIEIAAQKPDGSFLWADRFGDEYLPEVDARRGPLAHSVQAAPDAGRGDTDQAGLVRVRAPAADGVEMGGPSVRSGIY